MSVVYAVQNVLTVGPNGSLVPRYDISPALKYGELTYVFEKPKKLLGDSPVLIAEEILRSMGPNDYLLLIGDPTLIGICMKIVADLFGRVRILQWDRSSSQYEEYLIDFGS
jgi:hypothetical protein